MRKTILQEHQSLFVQKTARKDNKYSRNQRILKVGHLAKPIAHTKPIAFAKWSVWVKNQEFQKHAKNHFTKTLQLFCAKKPLEKTSNIREMSQFAKSAILQSLQPMQRLQPLQNGQFGSKIKNVKNMQKTILHKHQSCFVQKTAQKNNKYSRNERILKVGHLARPIAHGKAITFAKLNGQFGLKN